LCSSRSGGFTVEGDSQCHSAFEKLESPRLEKLLASGSITVIVILRNTNQVAWSAEVKTLAAEHPGAEYAQTRAFYAAMGFLPLEAFPTLWSPYLPVLRLVKPLVPP
jgi:hypothetical protein